MTSELQGGSGVNVLRDSIKGGGQTGSEMIGTSAVQLIGSPRNLFTGLNLAADVGNAGTLYVGFHSGITAGTASSTDGFPIIAGGQVPVSVLKMSDLWIIASQASQKIFWLAQ